MSGPQNIDEALVAVLREHAGVATLAGERIHPLHMPLNAVLKLPAILKTRSSSTRVHSLLGPSGLANPRYSVESWAETYDGALALAREVRLALDGYRGQVGAVRIDGIRLLTDQEFFDEYTLIHRVTQDYSVWHDE